MGRSHGNHRRVDRSTEASVSHRHTTARTPMAFRGMCRSVMTRPDAFKVNYHEPCRSHGGARSVVPAFRRGRSSAVRPVHHSTPCPFPVDRAPMSTPPSPSPSPLKRAANAVLKAMQPRRYAIAGKPFVCSCCGHDRFALGSLVAVLGFQSLTCSQCGHVDLFGSGVKMSQDPES